MKKEKLILSYYDFFWIFFVGGIFGYFYENIWYFLRKHVWIIKNGVVFGPFQPIYAFGILLVTIILYKIKDKKSIYLLLYGIVIGTIFEYCSSIFQEVVFGNYSWNYTKFGKLSINGRIFLPYCLGWGLLSLIWIKVFLLKIVNIFRKIPQKLNHILVISLSILIIINLIITSLVFYRKTTRYYNKNSYTYVERLIDKYFDDEYIKKRFPNLWIVK